MTAEHRQDDLVKSERGLFAWLRRIFAGEELRRASEEIAKLRADLDAAIRTRANDEAVRRDLEESLRVTQEKVRDLEDEIDGRPSASSDDLETATAPLRLELEQRAREQDELSRTIAKKEKERRDAQTRCSSLEKKVHDIETKLSEAHARLAKTESQLSRNEQSSRESVTLRDANARLERRCAELEARVVEALAESPSEPAALEQALRENQVLLEELEHALALARENAGGRAES